MSLATAFIFDEGAKRPFAKKQIKEKSGRQAALLGFLG
jgi:hypothetical protein